MVCMAPKCRRTKLAMTAQARVGEDEIAQESFVPVGQAVLRARSA
jgi:hypothetical protein